MSSEKLVVTKLQGGLGNQLFQLCAGLSIAEERGAKALFDVSSTGSHELNAVLDLVIDVAKPSDLRLAGFGVAEAVFTKRLLRARRKFLVRTGRLEFFQQRSDMAFQKYCSEALSRRARYVYLNGYFQHPSWCERHIVEVTQLVERFLRSIPEVEGLESGTVISFRRGDYVRLGWDLPMGYYESALRLIEPSNEPIWIVGDDALVIELIAEKWRVQGLDIRAMPELGVPDIQRDLAFLMRARQVIMSNSTFCWWGVMAGDVYRNTSPRRIIVPSRWLPLPGSESLIQTSWESVKVT